MRIDEQEAYVLALIGVVLPDREFEHTTMTTGMYGNYVRGIRTSDIYALLHATPEQHARAFLCAEAERKSAAHQRDAMQEEREAVLRNRVYPH